MDIVMLAAGTSSRMGKVNKMLLPYNGAPMVAHSCMQALGFLHDHSNLTGEKGTLIVVTGYRRPSVEKALLECRLFVERTDARLGMIVVDNPGYANGQFSSTKIGVRQVTGDFFISLADMPLIRKGHYEALVPMLEGHDAVRPFYQALDGERVPGHPVLHAHPLKDELLKYPDDFSVNRILKRFNVHEPSFNDPSWSKDVDCQSDYLEISL